jgi:two-component system phosphate regulon response regulator PhoB
MASPPDVVLIDLLLFDEALRLCRAVRTNVETRQPSVCVLSEMADEDCRVAVFEAGADDFVAKPYSVRELVLRARALARRRARRRPVDTAIQVGEVLIDRASRRVFVGGVQVHLTRREFDLLAYLSERIGSVQRRESLVENVWGDGAGSGRLVDTTIKRLRKKLNLPSLRTVRGVGYTLERGDTRAA